MKKAFFLFFLITILVNSCRTPTSSKLLHDTSSVTEEEVPEPLLQFIKDPVPDDKIVLGLVEKLGDPDFRTREQSSRGLVALGAGLLRSKIFEDRGLSSDTPEVGRRSEDIYAKLAAPYRPANFMRIRITLIDQMMRFIDASVSDDYFAEEEKLLLSYIAEWRQAMQKVDQSQPQEKLEKIGLSQLRKILEGKFFEIPPKTAAFEIVGNLKSKKGLARLELRDDVVIIDLQPAERTLENNLASIFKVSGTKLPEADFLKMIYDTETLKAKIGRPVFKKLSLTAPSLLMTYGPETTSRSWISALYIRSANDDQPLTPSGETKEILRRDAVSRATATLSELLRP